MSRNLSKFKQWQLLCVLCETLGTLSTDDDDGSERRRLKKKKKWICVLSNLIASVWTRSICQIKRLFLELNPKGFYSDSKRGTKIRRRISTSSIKRQILGGFTSWSCSGRQRNVLKRVMHVMTVPFMYNFWGLSNESPKIFWSLIFGILPPRWSYYSQKKET